MPRKQFLADLGQAQTGVLPLGISSLQQGDDDGQLLFTFKGIEPHDQMARITAMIADVSEYPKSHEYMIFCDDDTSAKVSKALEDIRGTNRKTVVELLDIVSKTLSKLSSDHDGDTSMPDSQVYEVDEDSDDDVYPSDDEAFEGRAHSTGPSSAPMSSNSKSQSSTREFRSRIRKDLRTVRGAGFKAGHLGHLLQGFNCFVTVSIRISKLGISEEAMQAWQIVPSEYLILLLQFPNGYKTLEELQNIEANRVATNIGFRVLTSRKYKPSLQEAIEAFTIVSKIKSEQDASAAPAELNPTDSGDATRETFVSRPLNSLLQERLVQILKYRSSGMDWRGGETMYMEVLRTGRIDSVAVLDDDYEPEPDNLALPDIVKADHMKSADPDKSFPTIAMQFLIRHFVRCTDFCLVCHRRLNDEVEAIKPYVCNSSLCLYQFMTLGFGPSIEHEILAQPYVVDLLVSFCYSSASTRKLKEFPVGLSLTVPPIESAVANAIGFPPNGRNVALDPQTPPTTTSSTTHCTSHQVGFDADRRELIFINRPDSCPVVRGSWIVLKVTSTINTPEFHCRVADVTYFPTISIDEPSIGHPPHPIEGQAPPLPDTARPSHLLESHPTQSATLPNWVPATFQKYDQDFEKLNDHEKCYSICSVLGTLPNVKEMQAYLKKSQNSDLKQWVSRISPAAMSLLRWIVASNRACIMQVDTEGESKAVSSDVKKSTNFGTSAERVYGMKDYFQFRFAMGAPDKEQRFTTEVRNKAISKSLQYPTIFAWHGSPLHNWHMIIREGLHFENTDHGRAYGNGVYHAKDALTSTGYSSINRGPHSGQWPSSVLNVSNALALNEIVNAPDEFVSHTPYFVVSQLDWIQTRYLFVSCSPESDTITIGGDRKLLNAHPQDPLRTPQGISGRVEIPASAIKSSKYAKDKRPTSGVLASRSPQKRIKGSGGFDDPIPIDDCDTDSVATDDEDIVILVEEAPEPVPDQALSVPGALSRVHSGPVTDFLPGVLDWATLPLMPVPDYAVSGTTKHLLKELRGLDQLQQSRPLAELGWYIDVEKIENVYQWIVELHSFAAINPKLPLVMDMTKKGVKSVVLEIRFNKDYPWTPPYVRVIRPRFLNFAQGGGGHVVMGGAMCMELLTNSGWSAVSSMESVLLQVRLAIASEPPARLDMHTMADYATGEAAEGYMRACKAHGWTVPSGFAEMAYGCVPVGSSGVVGSG